MAKRKYVVKKLSNPPGRPPVVLDEAKIEEIAASGCIVSEMAAYFGCAESTLHDKYSEAMRKGRLKGNVSLRRKMFEKALAGDTTMLIWLSKIILGMRDKSPDEVASTIINIIRKYDLEEAQQDVVISQQNVVKEIGKHEASAS